MKQPKLGRLSRTRKIKKIPPYEQSIGAVLLRAKESVLAPMRVKLRDLNITEQQWRVLRVLNDRGTTDATGLADVCNLHPPSVTRILRELVSRGYILREHDANDRRRTRMTLSPVGKEIVKNNSRDVLRLMQAYSDRFGADRLDRLMDELEALSATINGVE